MRKNVIFALGFFDGVHLGHQALLRQCRAMADSLGCQAAAITFDRHPQSLFSPTPPKLISSVQSRKLLLQAYGMDEIMEYPVVAEVMSMHWRAFLQQLLDRGAAGFVCGHDFRFGNRGEGNAEKLQSLCRELALPCVIVPQQTVDGIRISSTHIRRLIESGDMEQAVRFLGHPHILTGKVVPGQQLGRTIGIPTANLQLPEGLLVPRFGVYACRVWVDGKAYCAVTNIGTRPTVDGSGITVEPWLLDFQGNLYDREITVEFHKFLRPEMKFPSLEALRNEIHKNAAETKRFFENL